jgi:hypothetical protein
MSSSTGQGTQQAMASSVEEHRSPYEGILGDAFAALHSVVRRAHTAPLHAHGTMDVEHGKGWLVKPIVWMMKLPAAGHNQPVRLDVAENDSGLVWTRRIGRSVLRTHQCASGSVLVERSGLGSISFSIFVEEGALVYRQSSIRFAGLRVPSPLTPRVEARVCEAGDGWSVAVTVEWRARLVCRYGGTMRAI